MCVRYEGNRRSTTDFELQWITNTDLAKSNPWGWGVVRMTLGQPSRLGLESGHLRPRSPRARPMAFGRCQLTIVAHTTVTRLQGFWCARPARTGATSHCEKKEPLRPHSSECCAGSPPALEVEEPLPSPAAAIAPGRRLPLKHTATLFLLSFFLLAAACPLWPIEVNHSASCLDP